MHIYCKKCKKHTGNTFPKKLILISKNKIKGKSKYIISLTERTVIDEIEDVESELEIYLQFFTDWCYKKKKKKTYCLNCKKDTENLDSKVFKMKNNRLIMQAKCSDCENKKLRFIKEKEAKGL